jgi:adenylate cyclase class 2
LNEDVTDRQELEVEINNLDTMRKILEEIGFTVYVMYEKYRTTWIWMDCEITLDEMPYGYFCEIEGQDSVKIKQAADALGLHWDARILTSYLGIFTALKNAGKTKVDNLIFSAFTGYDNAQTHFESINIYPADIKS